MGLFGLLTGGRHLTKLAPLALAAFLCWQGWDYFGPHKPEPDATRRQLADRAVVSIVETLSRTFPETRSAALLPLENDSTDYITDNLRFSLEGTGILNLCDRSLGEKFSKALRLSQTSGARIDEALALGRSFDVDLVIFGTVNTFRSHPSGGGEIDMILQVADVAQGQVVQTIPYMGDLRGAEATVVAIEDQVEKMGWIQRLLGWIVIVLLLPVFTIAFIRAMVRKESNQTNAFTLAVYTVVNGLLAYLLLGLSFTSWLSMLLLLVATFCAFAYNVMIMTFALRLET